MTDWHELMDLIWRRRVVDVLPYVKRLDVASGCRSLRSGAPVKAYYGTPEQRAAARAKYACKNWGHWEFTADPGDDMSSPSGHYCWSHLIYGALGSMGALMRAERYLAEHHPDFLTTD